MSITYDPVMYHFIIKNLTEDLKILNYITSCVHNNIGQKNETR